MKTLHVTLPEPTLEQLRKRSDAEGVSISELIRRALLAQYGEAAKP